MSGASIGEMPELWAASLREGGAPAPLVHAGTGSCVGGSVSWWSVAVRLARRRIKSARITGSYRVPKPQSAVREDADAGIPTSGVGLPMRMQLIDFRTGSG